jgi:hypothetical protein
MPSWLREIFKDPEERAVIAWLGAGIVVAVSATWAKAAADNLQLCNDAGADPDARIPACTRLIEHPGRGINLAEIYNHRGVAKARNRDFGGAIEDFTNALSQNPNMWIL